METSSPLAIVTAFMSAMEQKSYDHGLAYVADGKLTFWREYFDFDTIRRDMERIFGVRQ